MCAARPSAACLRRTHEAAVELLALEGAMPLLELRPLEHLLETQPYEAVVRPVRHACAIVAEDKAIEAGRLVELEGHLGAAPRPARAWSPWRTMAPW